MAARPAIGVILAGGSARRLGGVDKGAVMLAGRRLFDHVHERLAPQFARIVIAGPNNYDTGLSVAKDLASGPNGPAAGLYAVCEWLAAHAPDVRGFLTAPVDTPFLPHDLAARLCAKDGPAIARVSGRRQPTIAYWDTAELRGFFSHSDAAAPALHDIASALGARDVDFDDETGFFNINTPEDLKAAEAIMAKRA